MEHTDRAQGREMVSREETWGEEIPLACDLGAIEAGSRTDHLMRAGHLLREVALTRVETVDGYQFRFRADEYARVVEFIGNERLCCPFLHFVLELPPAKGDLVLHIKGDEHARAFLRAELNLVWEPGA